jgi:carbonic anhydrase-like protein
LITTARPIYESDLPWDPERPDTVLITCVDSRWYHHFQEFARQHLKAGSRTDFLAVPGGIEPMTLADLVPKDFNFFRRRLESLIAAHGTRRIVAIAHQDCAWYRTRKIGPSTVDLKNRQIADLRSSASRLREMFEGVVVEIYFARLSGGNPDTVVFETV